MIIGKTRVDDYAEDTKISIEYDSEFKSITKGIDGARSVNQHNDYDAVILDIMLPKADGYKVLKYIREVKKNMPVLF